MLKLCYHKVFIVVYSMSLNQTLLQLINSVRDPFLNLTIEELGLNPTIQVTDQSIFIKLLAGFPVKPLESTLYPLLLEVIQTNYPSHDVTLSSSFVIKPHKTQMPGKGLRGVKNTIAVASGKGGVGKSTVAVNLAVALAKAGARVGLLDADIYGPSIPLMLGETKPVSVQGEFYVPVKAHGIEAMSIGYLTDSSQALIWRGPMLAKSLIQLLDKTLWDDLDYLFIDLPPGTGDIQLSLVQKIPLTGAVIVTTPQNVATLDAQKAIQLFERTNIDVLGLVENMSSHVCENCNHIEAIFGSGGGKRISESYNVSFLGELPLNGLIRSQADEGIPIVLQENSDIANSFLNTALKTSIALAKKPINYADKFPPIIVE